MGATGKGKVKAFYLNNDMESLFEEVRGELGGEGVANAQVLKQIMRDCKMHRETCLVENSSTNEEVHIPDIPADLNRPDKVVTWLEDIGRQIDGMSPPEAEKALLKMMKSRKEPTKAINAKSLYSPNSYHHFLKEAFLYKEPPVNMLWNIIQFYIKSAFAARAAGSNSIQMGAEFIREHMKTGKADMNDSDSFGVRDAKVQRFRNDQDGGVFH